MLIKLNKRESGDDKLNQGDDKPLVLCVKTTEEEKQTPTMLRGRCEDGKRINLEFDIKPDTERRTRLRFYSLHAKLKEKSEQSRLYDTFSTLRTTRNSPNNITWV